MGFMETKEKYVSRQSNTSSQKFQKSTSELSIKEKEDKKEEEKRKQWQMKELRRSKM
jgi:hypothetical protein